MKRDPNKPLVIQLSKQMADLTRPKCGACPIPLSCCEAIYCEGAIQYARLYWDTELPRTDHPKLPLMGPDGCTAAPHFRPLCAVHVCERHYMGDTDFAGAYFELREQFSEALLRHDAAIAPEDADLADVVSEEHIDSLVDEIHDAASVPVYRLMINRNCGAGPYHEVASSTNLALLQSKAEQYSEEGVRWVIEDEDGESADVSPIHKQIVATVAAANWGHDD
jgi:hypothetical protein